MFLTCNFLDLIPFLFICCPGITDFIFKTFSHCYFPLMFSYLYLIETEIFFLLRKQQLIIYNIQQLNLAICNRFGMALQHGEHRKHAELGGISAWHVAHGSCAIVDHRHQLHRCYIYVLFSWCFHLWLLHQAFQHHPHFWSLGDTGNSLFIYFCFNFFLKGFVSILIILSSQWCM